MLVSRIRALARQQNAVILAHNYQRPEIQDIADVVGDSLALSRAAAATDADTIVFCGVHFMAETAAILSPGKTVLLPEAAAGCSLADTITADDVRRWKSEHPGALVVVYVNTSVEVKAESDYCCTSGNAVDVVNAIPADREILFLPDFFLGAHVRRVTGRDNIRVWMGECHVHAGITPQSLAAQRAANPRAELLIHPECGCATSVVEAMSAGAVDAANAHVLSTEGMMRRPAESNASQFIVATETGILHRLRLMHPTKMFMAASDHAECSYMKLTTLESLARSLETMTHRIVVPERIAGRARLAIERMVSIGAGSPAVLAGVYE